MRAVALACAGLVFGFVLTWVAVQASSVRLARNTTGRVNGYGDCLRCGDSWDWKEPHVTEYAHVSGFPTEGCFPLCEDCWAALTPESRWPYYESLVIAWANEDYDSRQAEYLGALGLPDLYQEKRCLIREAVMEGK